MASYVLLDKQKKTKIQLTNILPVLDTVFPNKLSTSIKFMAGWEEMLFYGEKFIIILSFNSGTLIVYSEIKKTFWFPSLFFATTCTF